MKKTLVVVLLMVIWIGACSSDAKKDAVEVTHTILRYNQLLAQGYAKMDMTPLQEVATEEQARKLCRHMSALGVSRIRMESELVDIDFLDTQFPARDLAQVKTREKWDYVHVKTDEKMPSQTVVEGLIYKLSYELVRKDDRWFVSSVSVLEEDRAENISHGRSVK